jgi:4-hydroxybenzoate polyprenyltransferase
MHLSMLATLCWLVSLFGLGKLAMLGIGVVALLLLYEHLIVSPKDLRRMNAAFFTLNGVISVVFFGFVTADILLRR